MIKNLAFAGFFTLFALTACANNNANELGARDIYKEDGNTINVNNQRAELYNEGNGKKSLRRKSEDFGYVRHQRNPVMGTNSAGDHYAAVDREQLAKIISQFETDVPNVNDVSTLVTDDEVIVVYETDSKDRTLTADQVKKTAASVVPRWFEVYVTDNTKLRQDVENFATLDADSKNINTLLSGLIERVKSSTQGYSKSIEATE
ncbi:YhcN/YlaJ family sporulation lipoprotein [Bacillus marasmi]|uniref:YhcN/YlaJ family sporulation lipoprotein n=1 Tax=Bacillus marasmi TaxID=1926279 RepID=UPI0011CCB201|nr:YhcN/YlaJ family sporulation lipoprotein [Bacillus marasmi]